MNSNPTHPDAESRPAEPNLRILVAEDNPVNQKFTVRLLEKLGYNADVADDGHEAWLQITDRPYDVVLLDMEMPEMDGPEVARRVRDDWKAAHSRPYLIAVTANAVQGDREKYLEAGMQDYISKPIARETLVEALKRFTAGNRQGD